MQHFQLFITGVLLAVSAIAAGQELPPIESFTPNLYEAGQQNWAVDQDASGRIYVANNEGLLEYNGARWTLYPTRNQTILRSVGVRGDRVYTGTYMEFGYWERNPKGKLSYTSLSDSLSLKEDEQFWKILFREPFVVFQSLDRLYLHHIGENRTEIMEPEGAVTQAYTVDNDLYFQVDGKGIYQLEEGLPKARFTHEVLQEDVVLHMFKKGELWYFVTQDSGIWVEDVRGLRPWNTELQNLLEDKSVYVARESRVGSLWVGTIAHGLYRLHPDGTPALHLDQNSGLANNTVLSLFEDKDDNIWLGLDNGISVVNQASSFRVFKDASGALGTIYAMASHKGYTYLGTNQGLFVTADNASSFEKVPGTNGQVWSLVVKGGRLLCGHHLGTLEVEGLQIRLLNTLPGTWGFRDVPGKENLLLQGNYNGLQLLELGSEGWKSANRLSGFDISARDFEFYSPQDLLINHEYKGVFQLRLNEELTSVTEYSLLPDFPAGPKSALVRFDDRIFHARKEGIYIWKPEHKSFDKDSTLSSFFLGRDTYRSGRLIATDEGRNLWGFTEEALHLFSKSGITGSLEHQRYLFPKAGRKGLAGFENLYEMGDQTYGIGNAEGYILFQEKMPTPDLKELQIDKIAYGSRESDTLTLTSLRQEGTYPNVQNHLRISFFYPEYDAFTEVSYQHRVSGLYEAWSLPRKEGEVYLENLPHGNYRFEVRAVVNGEPIDGSVSYDFTIGKPWYLSGFAIFLYVMGSLSILFTVHAFSRRYYKRQQQRLIEANQKELELQAVSSEKEIIRLRNEKLQQEVESKSRELAASAMSMVKKNEFLNAIKKQLQPVKDQPEVKTVLRTIDRDLEGEKDWEFFEEAFNHADQDFLRKLRERHPKLTPNDLKLCAYLRLNLTSKEIAPLLNISVRSVEIKRYRLRKKMDLPHEDSLVSYILEL